MNSEEDSRRGMGIVLHRVWQTYGEGSFVSVTTRQRVQYFAKYDQGYLGLAMGWGKVW